jgi:predicted ribosomally synthesized peptide with nif11-like leader
MSIESARAFLHRMRNDLEFKHRIVSAESPAKRQEIIKGAGFDFSREHLDSLAGELSPEEMSALMLL